MAAAAGYSCVECQSTSVRFDSTPDGLVPVVTHWQLPDGSWCPATHGGLAARLASLDLLDALDAVMPLGQYGEPEPWHRRERMSA